MLTIYHLENSRSERVIWLAEELGLAYTLKKFSRSETGLASAEYKALHPLGRAPIIRDGDVTLIESGAIIDYLITRYGQGKLAPAASSPDYPRYVQFLHFAEGSMVQHLIMALILNMGGGGSDPRLPFIEERIDADFAFMNAAVANTPYFGGRDFSGADINLTFGLKFARDILNRNFNTLPHLSAYLSRIEARPAFKKAMSLA